MKKLCCIALTAAFVLGAFSLPEARAMDPVTIAILAPVALKVAKAAHPHVMRGLASGATQMVRMGKDVLEILLLPLGALEVTAGAPFGFFTSGLKHLCTGGLAPFKLALHAVLLPLAFCGVNVSG